MTAESMTGAELAESLLQDTDDEGIRAATRLLGAHDNGFWLRRLMEDRTLETAADRPLVKRSGGHRSVDWDALGRLMLTLGWSRRASRSEVAVLEVAASLVGGCAVQLRQVIEALDGAEFRLVLRAMEEAASGSAP
ncbi:MULTISPECIES: hypothetical protein [unclassified Streptomyces]|uniref:hypothetical protein n=1 Tax=unclassified Streptomyces TaxID=2593676 RepID=UPI002E2F31FD|nr:MULTISPECIES: hypothetical protein [unclassified Streptomyces]WUC68008.1 hypothetical protein OG861_29325 [Streptomyces sp. NBC_00539]